jgi:hypothetical protein
MRRRRPSMTSSTVLRKHQRRQGAAAMSGGSTICARPRSHRRFPCLNRKNVGHSTSTAAEAVKLRPSFAARNHRNETTPRFTSGPQRVSVLVIHFSGIMAVHSVNRTTIDHKNRESFRENLVGTRGRTPTPRFPTDSRSSIHARDGCAAAAETELRGDLPADA